MVTKWFTFPIHFDSLAFLKYQMLWLYYDEFIVVRESLNFWNINELVPNIEVALKVSWCRQALAYSIEVPCKCVSLLEGVKSPSSLL